MLVSNQIQRNFIYVAPLKTTIVDQGAVHYVGHHQQITGLNTIISQRKMIGLGFCFKLMQCSGRKTGRLSYSFGATTAKAGSPLVFNLT